MLEEFRIKRIEEAKFVNLLMDLLILDVKNNDGCYLKELTDEKILNTLIFNSYINDKKILEIKKFYYKDVCFRKVIVNGRKLSHNAINNACAQVRRTLAGMGVEGFSLQSKSVVYHEDESDVLNPGDNKKYAVKTKNGESPILVDKEVFFDDSLNERIHKTREIEITPFDKVSLTEKDILRKNYEVIQQEELLRKRRDDEEKHSKEDALYKEQELNKNEHLKRHQENEQIRAEVKELSNDINFIKQNLDSFTNSICQTLGELADVIRADIESREHQDGVTKKQDEMVSDEIDKIEEVSLIPVNPSEKNKKIDYRDSGKMNLSSEVVSACAIEKIIEETEGPDENPSEVIEKKCDIIRQNQYKFYLNASHAIKIGDSMGDIHSHSWEIVIDVLNVNNDFIQFNNIEKIITDIFDIYQKKVINDIEPFNKLNPTLENICLYFMKLIKRRLEPIGFKLLTIEISETPSRSYIINISDTIDKDVINEENIIIENFVDTFLDSIM